MFTTTSIPLPRTDSPPERALASNRAQQKFHKGMGQGNIGNRFDLGQLQYPQIGLPLPKPIRGIIVGVAVLSHPA